ncbi:hypothetical protein KSP39_PZI023178 [Platanthera zijinensis]|uniref:Uncharacterized protein n=1 Tax=Platanthera zijinensis TaxID=2320716 RepID=A0AAP0AWL6_9ASPA
MLLLCRMWRTSFVELLTHGSDAYTTLQILIVSSLHGLQAAQEDYSLCWFNLIASLPCQSLGQEGLSIYIQEFGYGGSDLIKCTSDVGNPKTSTLGEDGEQGACTQLSPPQEIHTFVGLWSGERHELLCYLEAANPFQQQNHFPKPPPLLWPQTLAATPPLFVDPLPHHLLSQDQSRSEKFSPRSVIPTTHISFFSPDPLPNIESTLPLPGSIYFRPKLVIHRRGAWTTTAIISTPSVPRLIAFPRIRIQSLQCLGHPATLVSLSLYWNI